MKSLAGDKYRVMPQVLDVAAEPLAVNCLEGHRISHSERTLVHASSLQDEYIILRLAAEWNKAYK
jgi:hypothetical protein